MTYQFKYMEIPEQKRTGGGGVFKGIKLFLEIAVTVVALGTIYNYHQDKPADVAAVPAAVEQQAGLTSHIIKQTGIAPSAQTLEQAQNMAEQFLANSDLSEFEKHAQSGEFDF
jgi:hypothetical protein